MFDVNLNAIELDTIYRLLNSDDPKTRDDVVDVIENLLEMRFNRGKKLGRAEFTDAIVDSIVYELKR